MVVRLNLLSAITSEGYGVGSSSDSSCDGFESQDKRTLFGNYEGYMINLSKGMSESFGLNFDDVLSVVQLEVFNSIRRYDPLRGVSFFHYFKMSGFRHIVDYCQEASKRQSKHVSLDETFVDSSGEEHGLHETLYDSTLSSPGELAQRNIDVGFIRSIVARLPERARRVIERRFGFNGFQPHELEEIAECGDEVINHKKGKRGEVTYQRIQQLQQETLEKLRKRFLKHFILER